ncbi:hypothetical protein DRI50_06810 [candidate division KSB1 bacterium]|jgi:hypothetical protein|nr:MAG: hypothetical protein DRI50_06810 [candidate division KSB1 bacterium]
MKRFFLFLLIFLFGQAMLQSGLLYAQDSTRVHQRKGNKRIPFVDKNGDGYNDLLPDHDGDGIPDIMDPDWHKKQKRKHHRFIDLDGDGINDLIFTGKGRGEGKMRMGAQEKWKNRAGAIGEEGAEMRGRHRGQGKGKGKK